MTLYQQTFDLPIGITRDGIHKMLERQFKIPTKDQDRDYIWGLVDGKICVRRSKFISELQTEVKMPKLGSTIEFNLSVAPKKGGTGKRKPITDYLELSSWIIRQFEGAGLVIQSREIKRVGFTLIGNPNLWGLDEIKFEGSCVVVDNTKLANVLEKGIASMGKCWGFGFLDLKNLFFSESKHQIIP
jgi:hypothetical protein